MPQVFGNLFRFSSRWARSRLTTLSSCPSSSSFAHLFQREMNDIVVVQLHWRKGVAEAQPQPVQEIDLVGGQVRCMRPEDFVDLVPVR